ncbi:oxidoreductase [Naegleria gruberi]|uniref:Oxidoreductase n=1 Tax=Naegleria gruberi TaxID=5762 RepID=D2VW34_NAEGR|nr:oxidoreductase [Naegleria gruberi]EFC39010.1 oxidoreductase [Naegleria gruberi]|eukprot:XP_002671754.1 oxidoreductase [Naegleria gruberi]
MISSSTISKQPHLETIDPNNIWLIKNLFSTEECSKLLKESEEIGYGEAPISTGPTSSTMMKDVRNNSRAMIDKKQYSDMLYKKLEKYLPQNVSSLKVGPQDGFKLCGLNERIRFYKYAAGEYFAPHYDGCFQRPTLNVEINGKKMKVVERSFITVLLYLNDVESGGETNFLNSRCEITHSVKPQAGQVLMFVHSNYHEGSVLSDPNEFKYVMRTDVMYRKEK